MKQLVLIFILILCLNSCNEHTKKDSETQEKVTKTSPLQIENFTEWPQEIIGYSCYSSKNKEDFNKRQYLLIDDYFNKALMNINGNKETLNLVSNDTLNTKKERRKIWKNNQFELNLETYEIDAFDEIWVHEGVLKLTSKNGERLEMTIFGHCGC